MNRHIQMANKEITSYILLSLFFINQVLCEECSGPLGMSDGRIKDSQITESSVMKRTTANGKQARLRQNVKPWGAWCPDDSGGSITERNYDQFIEIDLLNLTTITKIATQGRELSGGTEYARDYKISYSNYGEKWDYYREAPSNDVKIFRGNTNVNGVVRHELKPSIMARFIRVYPGYQSNFRVCMRLELYGCAVEKVIISYSMPVGQTTKNGRYHFDDRSYNGNTANGFYQGGTGILTDGQFASNNSKDSDGKGWVGWSSVNASLPYIEIIFQFSGVRKFKDVTLTLNVDRPRSNAVFNKSRIFFASTEGSFSKTFLQYCPKDFPYKDSPYNVNVTLSLCGNTASLVKMQLYFRRKWLLITEISFNSESTENKRPVNDCSETPSTTCSVNSPPSVIGVSTTEAPESGCKSCSTAVPEEISSDPNNLQMTIIIVCVVLLVIIILLVVMFLLYRRRALCFGKIKRDKTEKNIHVELHNVEHAEETTYDKIDDNLGNPLYASVGANDDDTAPMLSPVKKKPNEFIPSKDDRASELYSEPNVADMKPPVKEEYAEPVDSLQPNIDPDDIQGNPIYEGIYSEPLYGIAGTILVGPQEETLKRGYTMEKFPRDRLVFKEKIGDGQFGEVHIAEADIRDLNAQFGEDYAGKTKITVAVKTLKGDVKKDAKTDFFKEVRVMSRLQHENVVRLLGVCRDDPICMIVEYMENGDLNQFLKGHVLEDDNDVMIYANTKQPISYEELIYIASQVAAGMKYFAAMNFVHRDLAARNCLVGEGLTVKLADFGMSRLLYSKHYYRVQGRVMLPIRWMAPESIFQGRFTTQTDIWSFGITLWEIFTLARDFPYPNLPDEQVIGNAKTAFTKGDTGVIYNDKPDICPQDVFTMMSKCWSSDPTKRPDFNTLYEFLMAKVGSVETAVV